MLAASINRAMMTSLMMEAAVRLHLKFSKSIKIAFLRCWPESHALRKALASLDMWPPSSHHVLDLCKIRAFRTGDIPGVASCILILAQHSDISRLGSWSLSLSLRGPTVFEGPKPHIWEVSYVFRHLVRTPWISDQPFANPLPAKDKETRTNWNSWREESTAKT